MKLQFKLSYKVVCCFFVLFFARGIHGIHCAGMQGQIVRPSSRKSPWRRYEEPNSQPTEDPALGEGE